MTPYPTLAALTLPAVHDDDRAAALDAFLASVEKRALRIAELSTRDRDEALDIVQDAMLKLCRSYGTRDPAQWPALFYRILQNLTRDWGRRQSVRARVLFWQRDDDEETREPLYERIASPAPDAQAQAQQSQAMTVLIAALRALPRRQREVFELRIWQGLPVEDTARAMQCSEGSVKTHLHRALAALRQQLQGVWP